jgi:integrase
MGKGLDLPKGLRQRGNTIQANVYKKNPTTGDVVREAKTFKFKSYDEKIEAIRFAKQWKEGIEKKVELGLPIFDDETMSSTSWKLSVALEKTHQQVWLAKQKASTADTSYINGRTIVRILGGNKHLSEITSEDIFDARTKITNKSTNAYWNRVLTSLVGMMKHAKDVGCLGKPMGDPNEFAAIYRLKEQNKRRRAIKDEEVQQFLSTCRKSNDIDYHTFADLIEFNLDCGMRKGEIINLTLGHKKLIHGVPVIVLSAQETKGKRERGIPMSDKAQAIYKKHAKGKSQSDILFTKLNGSAFTSSSINHRFNEIKDKIGLDGDDAVVFHSTRNTFISNSINKAGMSLPEVQQTVGHNDMNTTQKYYNPSEDMYANIAAKLNKMGSK